MKRDGVITTNNISWKKMRFLSFNILRTRKGFHYKKYKRKKEELFRVSK